MGDPQQPVPDRLGDEYPTLLNFFETVLWPGVDTPNVFEALHRVMRNWHPDFVTRLVRELDHFSRDGQFSKAEVTDWFTCGSPEGWRVVDESNARDFVKVYAGFAGYLYRDDGVTGTA